jgi:hypothetical protein
MLLACAYVRGIEGEEERGGGGYSTYDQEGRWPIFNCISALKKNTINYI